MTEKELLQKNLLLGYDVSYGRLTLSNIKKFTKGKKQYQVHLDPDFISELYEKPEDAIKHFLDIKNRMKHE